MSSMSASPPGAYRAAASILSLFRNLPPDGEKFGVYDLGSRDALREFILMHMNLHDEFSGEQRLEQYKLLTHLFKYGKYPPKALPPKTERTLDELLTPQGTLGEDSLPKECFSKGRELEAECLSRSPCALKKPLPKFGGWNESAFMGAAKARERVRKARREPVRRRRWTNGSRVLWERERRSGLGRSPSASEKSEPLTFVCFGKLLVQKELVGDFIRMHRLLHRAAPELVLRTLAGLRKGGPDGRFTVIRFEDKIHPRTHFHPDLNTARTIYWPRKPFMFVDFKTRAPAMMALLHEEGHVNAMNYTWADSLVRICTPSKNGNLEELAIISSYEKPVAKALGLLLRDTHNTGFFLPATDIASTKCGLLARRGKGKWSRLGSHETKGDFAPIADTDTEITVRCGRENVTYDLRDLRDAFCAPFSGDESLKLLRRIFQNAQGNQDPISIGVDARGLPFYLNERQSKRLRTTDHDFAYQINHFLAALRVAGRDERLSPIASLHKPPSLAEALDEAPPSYENPPPYESAPHGSPPPFSRALKGVKSGEFYTTSCALPRPISAWARR